MHPLLLFLALFGFLLAVAAVVAAGAWVANRLFEFLYGRYGELGAAAAAVITICAVLAAVATALTLR